MTGLETEAGRKIIQKAFHLFIVDISLAQLTAFSWLITWLSR
jgi:hypothetical protein